MRKSREGVFWAQEMVGEVVGGGSCRIDILEDFEKTSQGNFSYLKYQNYLNHNLKLPRDPSFSGLQ